VPVEEFSCGGETDNFGSACEDVNDEGRKAEGEEGNPVREYDSFGLVSDIE
jgi:hypothetical protein